MNVSSALVFVGLLNLIALATVYALVRNWWVYEQRTRALWCEGIDGLWAHNALASYDDMLFKFWEWRLDRFVRPEDRGRFNAILERG